MSNDFSQASEGAGDADGGSPGTAQLAMHGVTTFRWTLTEDVVAASEFGLRNIGLWRRKVHEFGEEKSIELLRDYGMHVSSLSWAGGFTGFRNYRLDEALADAVEAIELAREMNAGCLVLTSGGRALHTWNHAKSLLIDAMRELLMHARRNGVTLAIQPMHDIFAGDSSFLTDLDSTLDVLSVLSDDRAKIAFDVYHLAEEPNLIERIPELVPQLAIVQLNDGTFPPRSRYDRCALGDGEIPLREIVSTLHTSGYRGCYEIALWSRQIWRSDYRHLIADCLHRFHEICDAPG